MPKALSSMSITEEKIIWKDQTILHINNVQLHQVEYYRIISNP